MTNINKQIIEQQVKEIIQLDDTLYQVYLENKFDPWSYDDLSKAFIANGFKINSINKADGWIRIEGSF